MKKAVRRLLGIVFLLAVLGLLAWAFVSSRRELEKERERERPAEAPGRLSRNAAGDLVIRLDPESRSRIDLKVEPLEARTLPREAKAYGKVLEPISLLGIHAELAGAEASLNASRAAYERAKTLYDAGQNASRRALEAAEAEFRADELRTRSAALRLEDAWGKDVAALSRAEREALLDRWVKRRSAFVLAQLPAGETLRDDPAGAAIALFGFEDRPLKADKVAAAPRADEKLQGQGFLLYFDAPALPLPPGAAVSVRLELPGEAQIGAVIPRPAVVRFEGKAWVYLEAAPDRFYRKEAPLERQVEGGWFAAAGFSAGERVVVTGAAALLSEELRSRIESAEEGE